MPLFYGATTQSQVQSRSCQSGCDLRGVACAILLIIRYFGAKSRNVKILPLKIGRSAKVIIYFAPNVQKKYGTCNTLQGTRAHHLVIQCILFTKHTPYSLNFEEINMYFTGLHGNHTSLYAVHALLHICINFMCKYFSVKNVQMQG